MLIEPLISLLIPIHGLAPYLEQTLESVDAITYKNLEILLILDRASTSATKISVNFCEKGSNRYVLESTTPGISAALNLGIAKSKGLYVARLDSDDKLDPERISRQVIEFQYDEKLVLVGTQMQIIDADNVFIRKTVYPIKSNAIKNLLPIRNCIGHPTVMFRKNASQRVGGYRSEFDGAEDLDLWLRLAPLGKFKNIDMPLTYYRISDNQASKLLLRNPGELEEKVLMRHFREVTGNKSGDRTSKLSLKNKIMLFAIRSLWRVAAEPRRGFVAELGAVLKGLIIYPIGTYRFCRYAISLKLHSGRQNK